MAQIKDPAKDLWQAFKNEKSSYTGLSGWVPKMLIEPYDIYIEED